MPFFFFYTPFGSFCLNRATDLGRHPFFYFGGGGGGRALSSLFACWLCNSFSGVQDCIYVVEYKAFCLLVQARNLCCCSTVLVQQEEPALVFWVGQTCTARSVV